MDGIDNWVDITLILVVQIGAVFSIFILLARVNQLGGAIMGVGKGLSGALRGAGRRGAKNRALGAIDGTNKLGRRALVPRALPGLIGNRKFGTGKSLNKRMGALNAKTTGFWTSPLRRGALWNQGGLPSVAGGLGAAAVAVGRKIPGLGRIPGVRAIGKGVEGASSGARQRYKAALMARRQKTGRKLGEEDAGVTGGNENASLATLPSVDDPGGATSLEHAAQRYVSLSGVTIEQARLAVARIEAEAGGARVGSAAIRQAHLIHFLHNKTNVEPHKIKDPETEEVSYDVSEEGGRDMLERLILPAAIMIHNAEAEASDFANNVGSKERPDQNAPAYGTKAGTAAQTAANYAAGGVDDIDQDENVILYKADGSVTTDSALGKPKKVFVTTKMANDWYDDALESGGVQAMMGDKRSTSNLVPAIVRRIKKIPAPDTRGADGMPVLGGSGANDRKRAEAYGHLAAMVYARNSLPPIAKKYLAEALQGTDDATGESILTTIERYKNETPEAFLAVYDTWVRKFGEAGELTGDAGVPDAEAIRKAAEAAGGMGGTPGDPRR